MSTPMNRALRRVIEERRKQEAKWGEQNHDLATWVTILTEEVGELAERALDHQFAKPHDYFVDGLRRTAPVERVRANAAIRAQHEAVQVAAVAVAILEYIDRHDLTKGCNWIYDQDQRV